MKDLFDRIDSWKSRANMFRDPAYLRRGATYGVAVFLLLWVLLGYDSGVGMLEIWQNNWQINWAAYGQSLHFSSIVIYGLLFWGLSHFQEKLGIGGSRNTFFSICLVFLNIAVFELVYMAAFTHFQMQRPLIDWFISDLWFLQQHLWILAMGIIALIMLYLESFEIKNHKVVGRRFSFKMNWLMGAALFAVASAFLFWILYPFPVETVCWEGWQSSPLFPQTNYAYVESTLYLQNDALHTVNVVTKALFAFTQLAILWGFKKE